MKALVIEKDAIRRNAAAVKARAGSAAIYAVLTGDGYGAGLVELARLLREEGIGRFAVSEPADAAALRKAGFVDEELLMLRSTTEREELEELMDLNVVCTIGSHDTGVALNGLAEARSTVVEAHIQIDTGLGFGGFLASEPEKVLSMYRYLPNVALSGIYTQLSSGSSALMGTDEARLDAVRVGSAFLGRCRRSRGDGLTTVGWGEATLEEIRWLPKGHTVGAGRPVKLRKPTRVAVLPVGSQNGFGVGRPPEGGLWAQLRAWMGARRRFVTIGEKRARVIGQIGALETLVDVTDLKCSSGDKAVFPLDPLYARGLKREYR